MHFKLLAAVILALFTLGVTQTALAVSSVRQNRVIVKFSDFANRQELINKHKARIVSEIPKLKATVIESDELGSTLIERLRRENGNIEYIELDAVATALTNDSLYSNQWALPKISWDKLDATASAFNISSPSAVIAIIDTGVDYNHPDLANVVDTTKDWDFANNDPDAMDDNLHGTHVAGIAAASTSNGIGVAGISVNTAKILPVKVLNQDGAGYYSWIANGIIYAADQGAKVINLSLGGNVKSTTLENAINYAWGKGVVIAAAAGNSGNTSRTYPAYYTNSIAVWASDQNDNKAPFSSYGSWVDVGAPGVNILSTVPESKDPDSTKDGYYYANGTSMATPHVAGLAGLLFSQHPDWTNQQVRNKIQSSADPVSGWLFNRGYLGKGRINVFKALTP